MLSQKVKKLAAKVREEVEIWVLGNPDIDPANLCGGCGIASYALYKVLIANGYKPSIVYGFGEDEGFHCWVTLDGYVIDITYTQFALSMDKVPKVYIVPVRKYEFEKRATNQRAIRFINKWQAQSPIIYKKDIKSLTKALTGV